MPMVIAPGDKVHNYQHLVKQSKNAIGWYKSEIHRFGAMLWISLK